MIRSEHSSWIEQCLGLHQLHFLKNKFICLILICNCTVLPTAPMKWKQWLFFISLLALFDRGSVEHSNICLAQLSKTLEAWALPLLRSIGHNHLIARVPVPFGRVMEWGTCRIWQVPFAKWFPKSWGIHGYPVSWLILNPVTHEFQLWHIDGPRKVVWRHCSDRSCNGTTFSIKAGVISTHQRRHCQKGRPGIIWYLQRGWNTNTPAEMRQHLKNQTQLQLHRPFSDLCPLPVYTQGRLPNQSFWCGCSRYCREQTAPVSVNKVPLPGNLGTWKVRYLQNSTRCCPWLCLKTWSLIFLPSNTWHHIPFRGIAHHVNCRWEIHEVEVEVRWGMHTA